MNLKTVLLILTPIFIASLLFLPIVLLNMIFEVSDAWVRIIYFIGLPIINITFLTLLIWKFKIVLDLKTVLLCVVIGLIYIIITFIFAERILIPRINIQSVGGLFGGSEILGTKIPGIIRTSIFIASSYFAFILGIFASQMVKNKILKILVFLLVGFGVSLIIFIPIISYILLQFFPLYLI